MQTTMLLYWPLAEHFEALVLYMKSKAGRGSLRQPHKYFSFLGKNTTFGRWRDANGSGVLDPEVGYPCRVLHAKAELWAGAGDQVSWCQSLLAGFGVMTSSCVADVSNSVYFVAKCIHPYRFGLISWEVSRAWCYIPCGAQPCCSRFTGERPGGQTLVWLCSGTACH